MSQEGKIQAIKKTPRTEIEDLSRPAEELSAEELALASGGVPNVTVNGGPLAFAPPGSSSQATRSASSCTAGSVSGPDTDYSTD